MNMKRFLAAVMALCMILTLAPVAPVRAAEAEKLEFEKLEGVKADLIGSNLGENRLPEENIDENEIVKVLILMDEKSILEDDSLAVMNTETQAQMTKLEKQQRSVIRAIEQNALGGERLQVNYQYTWLVNGIAANVRYGSIGDIEQVAGVDRVLLQPVYEVCETVAMPNTISGGAMIGRENTWADGYTGKGMTIAIVDTGLDYDHQNFAPLGSEKLTDTSMDADDISAVLPNLNAAARYEGLTVENLYYNTKVVYGFNYVDADLDITHADGRGDHGTHVAGIAAANKVDGSEVVGVAPDAQLLVMKVFGKNGGAYTEDIVAALEDALILGADVVNMSLGTTAGFTSDTAEVDAIYQRVATTGTVLSVSAGNSFTAGYGNTWGTDQNLTANIDNGLVGAPGLYTNVLTVASVENTMVHRNYIAAGDYQMTYNLSSNGYDRELTTLTESYGLVVIPGLGEPADYEGLDVTGKVALVQRGVTSFGEKHMAAEEAGAVAVIVYNNVADEEFGMDLTGSTATIPAVAISMADGEYLKAAIAGSADFTVSFPATTALMPSPLAYQMSDFSSWGVSPDLRLEPDITAPGGYIYSTVDNGKYDTMSGTSMAAPNISGLSALVMQYVEDTMPNAADKRVMVQNLLVSTAAPLVHQESGLYYSPRQQGAGLANAFNSVTTSAYLTVDGAQVPKASLYDDPAKTGAYSFAFNVHNFGDSNLYYALDTSVQTEDVADYSGIYFMAGVPRALAGSAVEASDAMALMHDLDNDADTDSHDAYYLYRASQGKGEVEGWENEAFRYDTNADDTVSTADVQAYLDALVGKESAADLEAEVLKVEAGETAVVTVNVALAAEDKTFFETYFPNGGYVEGFTTLSALHTEGVDLSLPYLGFYGDWNDAPLFDDGFYWDMFANGHNQELAQAVGSQYAHILWTQMNGEASQFIPGLNPYIDNEAFDMSHVSLSPNGDGYMDTVDDIYVSLMRNASSLTFRFSNQETGEVYYEVTRQNAAKTVFNTSYMEIVPFCYAWITEELYEFTDAKGNALPNNAQILLEVEAVGVNEGDEMESWSVPITIDIEAPELLDAELTEGEDGTTTLTLTFRDNLSAAVAGLVSSNGMEAIVLETVEDVEPDAEGYQNYTKTFDITGMGGKLIILLSDYAANETYYGINLGGEGTPYGELVAYQYNYDANTNGWVSFDTDVNLNETTIFTNFEMDFVAAEYVNGFVYAQTEDGALYGFKYSDMLNNTMTLEDVYITQLNNVYQDFAYDYATGKLLGLFTYVDGGYPTSEINTINIRGAYFDEDMYMNVEPYQEDWLQQRGGVYGLGLAVDDAGNLYLMGCNYDWDTESIGETAHLWVAPREVIADRWGSYVDYFFQDMGDTEISMDYLQSMTWNHNNEKLYWARFDGGASFTVSELYEVDVRVSEDLTVTYNGITKVGDLSGETCGLFAPLTRETAETEPHTNVPEMDETIPGTPILRKKLLNMSVGSQQTLAYDLDPWYTALRDVVWSSSDESVATVDRNGTVTAVSAGSAVITVTSAADETKFDTCAIEVSALSLKFEGVLSTMGSGIGNAHSSRMYEFSMAEGAAALTEKSLITAAEEMNYGLSIATTELARGSIWACEFGNTGMIYEINPDSGAVKQALLPINGDMVFGMHYSETLDSFTAVENFYLFTDLAMDEAMYEEMEGSYSEEDKNFMYHRINMLPYLREAGGSFITGETGQGASSEVVFCGITGIDGGIVDEYGGTYYNDTYKDYLGNWAMGGMCSYQPAQTLILLDNVGRLWYINEVPGVTVESDDWGNMFLFTPDGGMLDATRPGVILSEYTAADGTYTAFHITKIQETPLTDMFREGSMPRYTYHFSDIEFAGYTADGLPMIAMSLYDYWNNGISNRLYLYIPGGEFMDPNTYEYVEIPNRLYDLGNTGEYNFIASIHSAEVTGGVDEEASVETNAVRKLTAGLYSK